MTPQRHVLFWVSALAATLMFIWYLQNIVLPFIAGFGLMRGLLALILAVSLAAIGTPWAWPLSSQQHQSGPSGNIS